MFSLLNQPLLFLAYALALIIAITIHEFAHAYVADRLGDPTPRLQGRLTLNPLAHLDLLGTIMLFLVHFGWGKPVQFDPFNLRNPRRDAALISLAGPISNLVLAAIIAIVLRIMPFSPFGNVASAPVFLQLLGFILENIVVLNVVLAIFNLIPIHPLDGFKIVGGILPPQQANEWNQLQRYGLIFLIFLIFPLLGGVAPIHYLIGPPINFLLGLFLPNPQLL